jgi:hypothetical protein
MRAVLVGIALLFWELPVLAQQAPAVRPAVDGIFEAFQSHPLVGLGETHRRAQELDFYTALLRDPRFAREVGNVVVEFGGAAHQDIIDRYVSGEDVPYTELRKVWTDTVGWTGVVPAMGYQLFYGQVREINRGLPPESRIHVWLGEPVIDWAKINTHADWEQFNRLRDIHAADLIEREILARGKKALVIYGAGHFFTPLIPGPLGEKLAAADWQRPNLKVLVDQNHPGVFFAASFYTGAGNEACWEDFEQKTMSGWPVPALVEHLQGTAVAEALGRCNPLDVSRVNFPPGLSDTEKREAATIWIEGTARAQENMIYLGPRSRLTFAPSISDYFLDLDYFHEIARRYLLQTGEVLPPPSVSENPASPRFVNH